MKPKTTTRRHFAAYDADEAPDANEILSMIFSQLAKYVNPDTFKSFAGFWDFYYNNVLKVVYENIFKKVVAPVIAQQLKAAGVTKNKDVDEFFAVNIEAPVKQFLAMFPQMIGPLIDNFNAADAQKKANDFIDNMLKPAFREAINYLDQNKAVIKPHIIDFINNEYAKDAFDLLEDLKTMVKRDINA